MGSVATIMIVLIMKLIPQMELYVIFRNIGLLTNPTDPPLQLKTRLYDKLFCAA